MDISGSWALFTSSTKLLGDYQPLPTDVNLFTLTVGRDMRAYMSLLPF